MLKLRYSIHALKRHNSESWNAVTIREAYESGRLQEVELMIGDTADILCGSLDDVFVGLVLSKETNGERVIVTGFAAPREYWLNV